MGLRMNGETELTFKQLRELALAHHVKDSKTVIGIWAKLNGYSKRRKQKDNKVYTVYIKMSNDKSNNANLDKLNDFFSIFPKWGISVTIKLLKELKNDSEAMCNKYFSIISERILNELSARPDGLDVESYKKEASQLKIHFNRIKLCMRDTDFRFFIHEGLNEDMFHVLNNKVYGNLNTTKIHAMQNVEMNLLF